MQNFRKFWYNLNGEVVPLYIFGQPGVKVGAAARIGEGANIESENGLGWEEPAIDRDTFHKTRLFKAPSSLILSTSRGWGIHNLRVTCSRASPFS